MSIIDESLLPLRVYYGDNTHLYIGYLRHFKLGGFEHMGIKTITDLTKWIYDLGIVECEKGERKPLKYSSLVTEIDKVWAVIQKEDTEHIDPYGYDVRINH